MALCNLFADGQTDTCSRILILPMQPLKRLEDLFQVFLIEPDAIVFYEDPAIVVIVFSVDPDERFHFRAAVFE